MTPNFICRGYRLVAQSPIPALMGLIIGGLLPLTASADPVVGRIADWSLSQPVRISDIGAERYPNAGELRTLQWQAVISEPDGYIDIGQRAKPLSSNKSQVLVRTTLHATQRVTRALAFRCDEALSIYLNGQPVFRSQGERPSDNTPAPPEHPCNRTVWLPLESGDNELLFAVASGSASWGFAARDLDAIFQQACLTKLWELNTGTLCPESVACDAKRHVIYVSNFEGDCISKISFDGKTIDSTWIKNLKRPTGVKLFRDKFYVVERPGIAEIEPDSGNVLRHFPVAGASFLNDLAMQESGAIYATDSVKGRLYLVTADHSELWLEDPAIGQANGIIVEPTRLLVGVTADGSVKSVNLASKKIESFVTLGGGALMDGLVSDGRGGYLFSDYFGRVYHADAKGLRTLLLDRTGPRQFCADFDYLPEAQLLIMPSLYDQRLTAYRLDLDKLR